jgi:hypothetical protein
VREFERIDMARNLARGARATAAGAEGVDELLQIQYAEELANLEAMGFQDASLNASLLQSCRGNMQRVVETLVSMS